MTGRIYKDLHDVSSQPGWIVVRCRRCDNRARFIPQHLAYYFRNRKLDPRWPAIARYFKCRCGARMPEVGFWPTDGNFDFATIRFEQVPDPAPIGISQKTWNARHRRR